MQTSKERIEYFRSEGTLDGSWYCPICDAFISSNEVTDTKEHNLDGCNSNVAFLGNTQISKMNNYSGFKRALCQNILKEPIDKNAIPGTKVMYTGKGGYGIPGRKEYADRWLKEGDVYTIEEIKIDKEHNTSVKLEEVTGENYFNCRNFVEIDGVLC